MARPLRRSRALFAGALLAYLLVVAVAPALHHDFQCHVRHPGHCDACRANVAAPDVAQATHANPGSHVRSGAIAPETERARPEPGLGAESGRAPPDSV